MKKNILILFFCSVFLISCESDIENKVVNENGYELLQSMSNKIAKSDTSKTNIMFSNSYSSPVSKIIYSNIEQDTKISENFSAFKEFYEENSLKYPLEFLKESEEKAEETEGDSSTSKTYYYQDEYFSYAYKINSGVRSVRSGGIISRINDGNQTEVTTEVIDTGYAENTDKNSKIRYTLTISNTNSEKQELSKQLENFIESDDYSIINYLEGKYQILEYSNVNYIDAVNLDYYQYSITENKNLKNAFNANFYLKDNNIEKLVIKSIADYSSDELLERFKNDLNVIDTYLEKYDMTSSDISSVKGIVLSNLETNKTKEKIKIGNYSISIYKRARYNDNESKIVEVHIEKI